MASDEIDVAALRALLEQASQGDKEAAINTVEPGSSLDLTHDEMIALVSERIRRGGSRFHIVHVPSKGVGDGPLVVADTGNGPRSEVHAHLIAAALNHLPALLDAYEAQQEVSRG